MFISPIIELLRIADFDARTVVNEDGMTKMTLLLQRPSHPGSFLFAYVYFPIVSVCIVCKKNPWFDLK